MLLKSKTYRYLYRNLNTNHIITRNTPHPTIINDGVDDKLPQPREITYASDLLVFVNVKKNIIKIIKNKYGDGEDSDLKIYIQRLIEMCKRSEKIKSLYDSD